MKIYLAAFDENVNVRFVKDEAVLFAKVAFDMTTKEDRIRTCYMQACLAYVNYEAINNTTIRNLFGLSIKESYKASRIIKDAVEAQLLRPLDDTTAPRYEIYSVLGMI